MFTESVFSDNDRYEKIIATISKRFTTYGYKRIKTSAFQQYDLYSTVKSSINQNEMIKIIDYTGEVLVLRPDVTIPVVLEMAKTIDQLVEEARYYYVQEVFRQPFNPNNRIASTQAGIEYFCESSPEADAEVIALACHTMKDLGFTDVKVEIGHAAFFNEMIQDLALTDSQVAHLKKLIQAKNSVEIEPYLLNLQIDQTICAEIGKIPFLYGKPEDVFSRMNEDLMSSRMKETVVYSRRVFEILKMYGLEQTIALDLGLINHMDYYSGVVFQGYIGNFGKPVLMGGRYDQLGKEIGVDLPAIGFACEIELLAEASEGKGSETPCVDVKVFYEGADIEEAIWIANQLRNNKKRVLTFPMKRVQFDTTLSTSTIHLKAADKTIHRKNDISSFTTKEEIVAYLIEEKEFSEWTI
jgi:ATP phosphoribosyltransferase regulatory subunit